MRKKIILTLIFLTLLLCLTGCDSKEQEESNSDTSNEKYDLLADVVEVGDYVNYDASSGLTTPITYTPDSSLTGYDGTEPTYSSEDETKWRVLSIDSETKVVELMAEAPKSYLYLTGKEGYINAETVLNEIGAVYGKGKGATAGRSIKLEDIEQYSSYDPTAFKDSTGISYGDTKTYTEGTFIKTTNVTGGEADKTDSRLVKATKSNPVTVKSNVYGYEAKDYFENETIYNMFFEDYSYWLASKSVWTYFSYGSCYYVNIASLLYGISNSGWLYQSMSDGAGDTDANAVMPVVTLKANIQTSGKDSNGAWNLIVE